LKAVTVTVTIVPVIQTGANVRLYHRRPSLATCYIICFRELFTIKAAINGIEERMLPATAFMSSPDRSVEPTGTC